MESPFSLRLPGGPPPPPPPPTQLQMASIGSVSSKPEAKLPEAEVFLAPYYFTR